MFAVCVLHILFAAAEPVEPWPVSNVNTPENKPIVEVTLSPAEKPLPEVAAEIALLDAEREKLEGQGADLVQSAINSAESNADVYTKGAVRNILASADIPRVIRRHTPAASFLQTSEGASAKRSLRVSIGESEPVPPELKSDLDALSQEEYLREQELYSTLAKETIPNVIPSAVAQFKAALQSQMASLSREVQSPQVSFLQTRSLPEDINVRVKETDATWPTVESLASNMLQRASESERMTRLKFLDDEAKMFKMENEILRQEASTALAKILATPA